MRARDVLPAFVLMMTACPSTPTHSPGNAEAGAPTASGAADSSLLPVVGAPVGDADTAPLFDAKAGILGALQIGMAHADALRVMPLGPHPSGQLGDNVRVSGPYHVVFGPEGAISSIEYNVTQSRRGVRIGAFTLPPSADDEDLANAMGSGPSVAQPSCGTREAVEGGSQRTCLGGRARIKVGMSCAKTDARGACAEWSHAKLDVFVQVFAN